MTGLRTYPFVAVEVVQLDDGRVQMTLRPATDGATGTYVRLEPDVAVLVAQEILAACGLQPPEPVVPESWAG